MSGRTLIPLHRPWIGEAEETAVLRVLGSGRLAGNGPECAALERELATRLGLPAVAALSSATHALELSMLLHGVEGGEVIVPSFTFPSVGSAVLKAGGTLRFCEVRTPDLNVDLDHARSLIGPSTRALVVTHYAGNPQSFRDFPVPVIEDAAHALGSRIDGRACGTLGVFGCFSFHATKNVVAGEGGALVASSPDALARARIIREKGTNREDFAAGRVDFYAWVDVGSSLVLPELSAAIARTQLARFDRIQDARRTVARQYDDALADLERSGRLEVVRPADGGVSSHHIYGILVDPLERRAVADRMRAGGVEVASHFVPLHASPQGQAVAGKVSLPRTDRLAASLLRLPIYPGLTRDDVQHVATTLARALTS